MNCRIMDEVNCKFELTLGDLRKATFRKITTGGYRIYYGVMLLILIASITTYNVLPNAKNWADLVGFCSAIALVAPYFYSLGMTSRWYDRVYKNLNDARIIFDSDGIRFDSEQYKEGFTWDRVKSISETEDFVFVNLPSGRYLLLKKMNLNPDEISCLYTLYNQMQKKPEGR